MDLKKILAVARGDMPADLIISGGSVVNVFTEEILDVNIAIADGVIAGVGDYSHGHETIKVLGAHVMPGFIDAHIHLESAHIRPEDFALLAVAHGTSAVIADPHEIANVAGKCGVRYMIEATRNLPMQFYFTAPSCVPATRMETAGASLSPEDILEIVGWERVLGLAEMMNFPGAYYGDESILQKIASVGNRPVDGHAPGLSGKRLNAYIAAGIGSDHESLSYDEGLEKIRAGMTLFIREGSSAKNLASLLPLVTDQNAAMFCFASDDLNAAELRDKGHIDRIIRKAMRLGMPLARAVRLATINTARHFGIRKSGAIAPGYMADIIIAERSPEFSINQVYHRGKLVAENGETLVTPSRYRDTAIENSFRMAPLSPRKLAIRARKSGEFPVINVAGDQLFTKMTSEKPLTANGCFIGDTTTDLLKIAVFERHKKTGNIGVGLIRGFGLTRGALASSVAHDSHNIVAVGVDDTSILSAVQAVVNMQGGFAAFDGERITAELPMPIAGLMSDLHSEDVIKRIAHLHAAACSLGCTLDTPFDTLSFMALPVIPEIKITDLGLVDVLKFQLIAVQ